jgi:UDP-galactopyranose mutase
LKIVIVGSGFFGSVLAERITSVLNIPVTVIEKREHIGGNCYSEINLETNIEYHAYGPHIFHTSNETVWNYINNFTEFTSYKHQVLSTHNDTVYQMPVNLETINSFYNLNLKPYEVESFLQSEIAKEANLDLTNFEDYTISKIGRPLYNAFIKGYTHKQWNLDPREMPASIAMRLPYRSNYEESYYHSKWQGMPTKGYTAIFKKLLSNKQIELKLNTDFFDIRDQFNDVDLLIYSGPIDRFFDYKHGKLDWRTLHFEHQIMDVDDFQGTAQMNFADLDIPYTRIIEPKHFHPEREQISDKTLIIKEFSKLDDGSNPYYPINNVKNQELIIKYKEMAKAEKNLIIAGRLGDYKYYDMHQTIASALLAFEDIKKRFESI